MAIDRAHREGAILLSLGHPHGAIRGSEPEQFRGYIDEEDMRRFLAVLTREAQWIDVDVQITACRDPKDDKFISLAVCGQATHIVTGDADLLALHPFQGVRIVTPSTFLEAE